MPKAPYNAKRGCYSPLRHVARGAERHGHEGLHRAPKSLCMLEKDQCSGAAYISNTRSTGSVSEVSPDPQQAEAELRPSSSSNSHREKEDVPSSPFFPDPVELRMESVSSWASSMSGVKSTEAAWASLPVGSPPSSSPVCSKEHRIHRVSERPRSSRALANAGECDMQFACLNARLDMIRACNPPQPLFTSNINCTRHAVGNSQDSRNQQRTAAFQTSYDWNAKVQPLPSTCCSAHTCEEGATLVQQPHAGRERTPRNRVFPTIAPSRLTKPSTLLCSDEIDVFAVGGAAGVT